MTDDEKLALVDKIETHQWVCLGEDYEREHDGLFFSESGDFGNLDMLTIIERCQRIRANLQGEREQPDEAAQGRGFQALQTQVHGVTKWASQHR